MKRFFMIPVIIVFISFVLPLHAGILDELSSVNGKSDVFMYINIENLLSFLKQKGININEIDELAFNDTKNAGNKTPADFGLKPGDIKEILFAGCVEDFEKNGGFLIFITVNNGKGNIPESLKSKSEKIDGISFYETESGNGIFFTLIEQTFIIGSKEYVKSYLNKKKLKPAILTESAKIFKNNADKKDLYINLSVSDYLRNEMDKAYTQGTLFARGLSDNVFLKTLLNLKSVEYGIKINDRIHLFAGMQGTHEVDSERLLMLTHFAIVGTSFAASFADIIASRSGDNTLEKVTAGNEILSSLQHIIARMKTTRIANGVLISFDLTEKETGAIVDFVKKNIEEKKKALAENLESEKISLITKAITDKDTVKTEILLNGKFDINRKDLDGNSILSTAAFMGDVKIASIAITKGANIELKNSEGLTPLHYAAKGGNVEIVKFLIQKGADISAKTENEMTPLHYNSQQGNSEITKILLAAGADVNAAAMDGSTPSHIACEEGYIDVVKIFSEKGADFNIRNVNGERAVEVASRNGYSAIADFFKSEYNMEPLPVTDLDSETGNDFDDEYNEESD
ncbi:MAG TPA: ankyrin repeat domain-containing protein [Spirochaetota bacterium]|nr:ankyrin repeat domain-containing protein [Spirochaetota bacterium]